MRAFRDLSISRKLMVIVMVTSSVALLLSTISIAGYDLYSFRRAKLDDLTTLAEVIGSNSTAALTFQDSNAAKEILGALSAKTHVTAACIYTREGRVFATYLRGNPAGTFSPPPAEHDGSHFEHGQLALFRTISLEGEKLGTVYLQYDLLEIREGLKRDVAVLLIVALGSSFVALLLSSKLQRAISEPIRSLAWTTKVLSVERDYSIRVAKQSGDEMGLLVEGFNEMLEQIQRRDTELQTARDNLERRVEERTAELGLEVVERKHAEEALRESEEHARLLLDSTAEAIYGVDLEGNCTFCNPATLRMLGYRETGELLGKNMHALAHHTRPDGTPYPPQECRIYQAFRKGKGTHVDDEVRWRADGTSFPVELWSLPIRRAGQVVGFVVTFIDITERKRAEEKLQERTAYLNALIENSPLAIVVADAQHRVKMCNQAFERL